MPERAERKPVQPEKQKDSSIGTFYLEKAMGVSNRLGLASALSLTEDRDHIVLSYALAARLVKMDIYEGQQILHNYPHNLRGIVASLFVRVGKRIGRFEAGLNSLEESLHSYMEKQYDETQRKRPRDIELAVNELVAISTIGQRKGIQISPTPEIVEEWGVRWRERINQEPVTS